MTIVDLIKEDNIELATRLTEFIDLNTAAADEALADIRMWCFDAASSEMAKEKVLYERLENAKYLVGDVLQILSVVRKSSDEFKRAAEEIMSREPHDRSWDDWISITKNSFKAKNREELQLLDLLPTVFSDKALRDLSTEFERARESHEEIGIFQQPSMPLRPNPNPNERP